MICRINVSSYRFWLPVALIVMVYLNTCWHNMQLDKEIARLRQQLELYKFYTPPAHHTPLPMVE